MYVNVKQTEYKRKYFEYHIYKDFYNMFLMMNA